LSTSLISLSVSVSACLSTSPLIHIHIYTQTSYWFYFSRKPTQGLPSAWHMCQMPSYALGRNFFPLGTEWPSHCNLSGNGTMEEPGLVLLTSGPMLSSFPGSPHMFSLGQCRPYRLNVKGIIWPWALKSDSCSAICELCSVGHVT
jgi:hypothetical protein